MENNISYIKNYLTKHQDKLKQYAYRLTNYNIDDALDLFQETAYRSMVFQHHYKEEGHIEAWIYTIMRNIFINEYNKSHNQNNIYDITDHNIIDETSSPDDAYSIKELYDVIASMKNEKHKKIILMRIQGYSYEEIAKEMSIKVGTIKSTLFRIKHYIKDLLR